MLIVIVVVFLLTSNFYLNFSLYFIIGNLIVRSVNIRIVSFFFFLFILYKNKKKKSVKV